MNLQFISDSAGETTGVYIPIQEWNELKNKFKGIEQVEMDLPLWHINEVRRRLEEYKNNPESGIDFDEAINEIEKDS